MAIGCSSHGRTDGLSTPSRQSSRTRRASSSVVKATSSRSPGHGHRPGKASATAVVSSMRTRSPGSDWDAGCDRVRFALPAGQVDDWAGVPSWSTKGRASSCDPQSPGRDPARSAHSVAIAPRTNEEDRAYSPVSIPPRGEAESSPLEGPALRAVRRYQWHGVLFIVGLILGVAAYAQIGPGAVELDVGVQAALLLVCLIACTPGEEVQSTHPMVQLAGRFTTSPGEFGRCASLVEDSGHVTVLFLPDGWTIGGEPPVLMDETGGRVAVDGDRVEVMGPSGTIGETGCSDKPPFVVRRILLAP